MTKLRLILRGLLLATTAVAISATPVFADQSQSELINSGITNYEITSTCSGVSGLVVGSTKPNVAHAANYILAQDRAIGLYKQIGQQANIPWQMLAVVHYREHSNKLSNSGSTGSIIYKGKSVEVSEGAWGFFAGNVVRALDAGADLTPNKNLSDAEFITQGLVAAAILKEKAGSKVGQLTVTTTTFGVIGYTFFGYNGRAQAYIDQAKKLGFSTEDADNGAGSPYVVNFLTDKQSPSNPQWGQIVSNGGPLVYPATQQIGAWTLFEAISGVSQPADCGGVGAVGSIQRVVDLAKRVPAGIRIAQAKQLGLVDPGYPNSASWCAVFVSQLFKNAGLKLPGTGWGDGIYSWAADFARLPTAYPSQFTIIDPFAGQKAQPGDAIVFSYNQIRSEDDWQRQYRQVSITALGSGGDGIQHVGLVVAVDGNKISTVEGNTVNNPPNGVTSKNTYNYIPGQSSGWEGQIFAFVRMTSNGN